MPPTNHRNRLALRDTSLNSCSRPTLTKISRHTSPNTTMEPEFGEWDRANWHGRRSLRETAFFYSKQPRNLTTPHVDRD
jgi:hypothetical protein